MTKTSLIALVAMLGFVGQAAAQGAGTTCPTQDKGEARPAFSQRVQGYCEAQWSGMVAGRETGGQTHDEFFKSCARKCTGNTNRISTDQTTTWAVLGTIAGVAAVAGGVSSGGSPASP